MSKKSILFIVGSFRKNSFNQAVADYINETVKEKVNTSFLEYKNIPLLQQDSEYPTPEEIISIRKQVREADALWVISPEYNGSYPAVVKNLMDWLSRPEKAFDFETPTAINGKPVTASGIGGSTAAKFVRHNLFTLFKYIRMNPIPGEGTGLTASPESWKTGILSLSKQQKEELDKQIDEFLKFIEA